MKHNVKITLLLLAFFVVAQAVGLYLVNQEMDVSVVDGKTQTSYGDTALGERPDISGSGAFLYMVIGVGVGTALLLAIIKFKRMNLWKIWFFIASMLSMVLALGAVIPTIWAVAAAAVLAGFKVFKPTVILHNVTEVLIYSGIAVFFVPILDLTWAIVLLLAFSAYDAYAVWKSKHMVAMAEFQSESKLFAGLNIPYSKKDSKVKDIKKAELKTESKPSKKKTTQYKSAILGGGDIALPLLFAGAVMQWLVQSGVDKVAALWQSLIISLFAAMSLLALFVLAEKDKFYPAMPFITSGCLVGLGIVWLL